jgi:hypothetical protein
VPVTRKTVVLIESLRSECRDHSAPRLDTDIIPRSGLQFVKMSEGIRQTGVCGRTQLRHKALSIRGSPVREINDRLSQPQAEIRMHMYCVLSRRTKRNDLDLDQNRRDPKDCGLKGIERASFEDI